MYCVNIYLHFLKKRYLGSQWLALQRYQSRNVTAYFGSPGLTSYFCIFSGPANRYWKWLEQNWREGLLPLQAVHWWICILSRRMSRTHFKMHKVRLLECKVEPYGFFMVIGISPLNVRIKQMNTLFDQEMILKLHTLCIVIDQTPISTFCFKVDLSKNHLSYRNKWYFIF